MKYTPSTITDKNLFYNIPIYQRLFEWDTENIVTLLEDLKKEYVNTQGKGDYYIGMLTSTKDNELVDGQQRFTVITLLGCVLQDYYPLWKTFLIDDNKVRLDFTSRPLDRNYLRSIIEKEDNKELPYKNLKMYNGLRKIKEFMEEFTIRPKKEDTLSEGSEDEDEKDKASEVDSSATISTKEDKAVAFSSRGEVKFSNEPKDGNTLEDTILIEVKEVKDEEGSIEKESKGVELNEVDSSSEEIKDIRLLERTSNGTDSEDINSNVAPSKDTVSEGISSNVAPSNETDSEVINSYVIPSNGTDPKGISPLERTANETDSVAINSNVIPSKDPNSIDLNSKEEFAKYIFHHLSFFISDLPEGYSPRDLNKYFERMNTTGKNLEQHEILKVKLLGNLDKDIDPYMLLWNKLSDVDSLLIYPRKNKRKDDREEESEEEKENIRWRKQRALTTDIATVFSENLINSLDENVQENSVSIGDIEMSSKAPHNQRSKTIESRSALSFPYLLLQVLYRKILQDNRRNNISNIDEFFKPANLLSIFEKYLPFSGNKVNKEDIKDFMECLLRARLALDICFVRPTEYGYSLDMNMSEDNPELKKLMMFQSMLYVSSSNYTNYRWFNWLMNQVDKYGIPSADGLYLSLKEKCDQTFPLPKYEDLTYKGDNRYWFWRLDFHIWLNRKMLFEKDTPRLIIAENYIFKRNRSIEHIAPQTPQSNSMMKWDDSENESSEDAKLRDSFGNLVMISQGLNSALSNESYEVKTAHVQSYYNGSKSGSIESLKLLLVHKDYPDGWTKDRIMEHGQKMYRLLQESYNITMPESETEQS